MDKATFTETQVELFRESLDKTPSTLDDYNYSWFIDVVKVAMVAAYKSGLEKGWAKGEEEQRWTPPLEECWPPNEPRCEFLKGGYYVPLDDPERIWRWKPMRCDHADFDGMVCPKEKDGKSAVC